MRSTISSKSGMILPKASCISITASAARLRSSNDGCLIKIPLYVDEVIAAPIRFKPQVWQEQAAAKRADRKMWERKVKTSPEGLYFPLPHFSVRALKISLDSRMREYYFHSVLAQ